MKNPSKYYGNELEYLNNVLNSESWSSTGGSWTSNFESEFAKLFNMKYAVAFNSGTSTLHAALEAIGVGPGDEVLSPALTVFMDASATFHSNAVPVFVDVDPETFTMDPNDLENKITSNSKAIIVVALYGLPADLDKIMKIAERYDLKVIEDNAQCFLSKYKGRLTGSIGDIASYSFENTKHLSCGEGGMIITNNAKLAENCRKYGGHGFKNLSASEGRVRLNQDVFQNPKYKRHDKIGWNYRMPEIIAAVGMAQLEKIDEAINLRKESAKTFLNVINETDFLIPQKLPDQYTNSYYTLGVLYEGEKKYGVKWNEFRKMYIEEGGDGFYGAWSVPYLEPAIKGRNFVRRYPEIYKNINYENNRCPIAEDIQKRLMQFKTNYRDHRIAKRKAASLKRTIQKLDKSF